MYIKCIGLIDANWIHVAQARDTWGSFEHGNNPLGSVESEEFLDHVSVSILSSSKRTMLNGVNYELFVNIILFPTQEG
jgi:hypothetical protein